jgi:nucleotide-binding universal stress UspA family protein
MSYKTILVHLDAGRRRRERLDLAFTLAERFDAHLVGLFGLEPVVLAATPENGAALLMAEMMKQRQALSEKVAAEFRDKMRKEQYSGKSEWRATLDDGFAALEFHAKYADLIVAGQPDPEGFSVPAWFAHRLVMSIGRPVLYVPFAGRFEDCGKRVLVSWNASREAARAVRDSLPFLREAEHTEVVTFNPEKLFLDDPALPDPDMGAYLARHGAKVEVANQATSLDDIGALILSRAADESADLIVMGAYSHSRLREIVLGGATREIFKSMTVPTLMSH